MIALAEVVILKVLRFNHTTNTHQTAVRKTIAWWGFSYAKMRMYQNKNLIRKINFETIPLFVDTIISLIISNFILLIGGVLKHKFFKIFYW